MNLSTPKKSLVTKPPRIAQEPLRIVCIGGGTGLSTLLHGLKLHAVAERPKVSLTAIVTVTDDGGSSGRLRRDFKVLPPGDVRNCIVALSEDEALLSKLFQYRFSGGHGLNGHSFGNLFLTALTHLTGDFASAIRFASGVLASCGTILPSTTENVVIAAKLADGTLLTGESRISRTKSMIREIRISPRRPQPLPATLEAIRNADLITMGPGSLFTSVIPNLLVQGIPQAIAASPALKTFISNLMWQPGETMNFTASDHVRATLRHTGLKGEERARFIEYIILNSQGISPRQLGKYAAKRALPVENDSAALRALGIEVVKAELLASSEKIRHDPKALADTVVKLARLGRRRRQIPVALQKS